MRCDSEIIAIQPKPTTTLKTRFWIANTHVTAIARQWNDDDPLRCRLCDYCSAVSNMCLVMVTGDVSAESAPLFSTVGFGRKTWIFDYSGKTVGFSGNEDVGLRSNQFSNRLRVLADKIHASTSDKDDFEESDLEPKSQFYPIANPKGGLE